MNDRVIRLCINKNASVLSAIKQMDELRRKLLIVLDDNYFFYRLISIGDIQRAIIANVGFDAPIDTILRNENNVASTVDDVEQIKESMCRRRIEFMPIINEKNEIVNVLFWEDMFSNERHGEHMPFNLPVVIMAGGEGSRLKPLTNVLPKPLIPIGNQTMLEDIMDRFVDCGCHNFYISVNYKADIIKRYFENLNSPRYNIEYFQENKPLGTAGSLYLLNDKINSTFFVSNCDIIIDNDYADILDCHRKNHNEITVVAAIKNYSIPYGTLESGDCGLLRSIQEKPDLTIKINTGMYILEPHLINEIPRGEFYHITFLIDKLLQERRRVGIFPINEGSWIDVGNWDEYMKHIK